MTPADQSDSQTPEPKDTRHVLSIEALSPERPYITIDGERHDLRMVQDFGALEHQELTRKTVEYDELWSGPLTKKEDRRRYEALLDWLFGKVLVDPKAVREQLGDKLTGAIKREIVLTFSNAPQLMAILQAAARQTGNTLPGNSSTLES